MAKLPENKRRTATSPTKRTMWLYGSPFSGKTTFADSAPDPLMLNTDGNAEYVTAPYISIQDEITVNGRMTQRKMAWQVFKEYLDELEKGGNTYKTIVLDLVNDLYESCRLYMYNKLGITHESDDSFRAWDKVRTEYLSTIKRLLNLDYNIILISHEDASKDLTKKGGDKVTAIMPNLNEKASKKIAGMVDLVARLVVDGDKRTLNFKSDEVVFGGGRLQGVKSNECKLSWDALCDVYDEAIGKQIKPKSQPTPTAVAEPESVEEPDATTGIKVIEEENPMTEHTVEVVVEPVRRTRRKREE